MFRIRYKQIGFRNDNTTGLDQILVVEDEDQITIRIGVGVGQILVLEDEDQS